MTFKLRDIRFCMRSKCNNCISPNREILSTYFNILLAYESHWNVHHPQSATVIRENWSKRSQQQERTVKERTGVTSSRRAVTVNK